MDDVNPMRGREARDDLRERVMDGLASGIEKGTIRHVLVLALLDLADDGETAAASADAYLAEMTALRRERDEARHLASRAGLVLTVCGRLPVVHSDIDDCPCEACMLVRDVPEGWQP